MIESLKIDDFSARIGDVFGVEADGHAEGLTLMEATAARLEPPSGFPRPFSLIFHGESRTRWLSQGVWRLEHPELPRLELFLTCLGPTDDGRFRYEAAFA